MDACVPIKGTSMDSITSVNGRGALLDQQTAIAELAKILINDETLSGVPGKVAALAQGCIPGADEVSITLITRGTPHTAGATGELPIGLDQRQYDSSHGPCLDTPPTRWGSAAACPFP